MLTVMGSLTKAFEVRQISRAASHKARLFLVYIKGVSFLARQLPIALPPAAAGKSAFRL